jgi:hypothetical protein
MIYNGTGPVIKKARRCMASLVIILNRVYAFTAKIFYKPMKG